MYVLPLRKHAAQYIFESRNRRIIDQTHGKQQITRLRHAIPHLQPTYTRRASDAWPPEELLTLPSEIRPRTDETLDLILRRKIFLLQARRGYRANVDSHILANFSSSCYTAKQLPTDNAQVSASVLRRPPRVLDIGAGSGIVSILFCRKHHHHISPSASPSASDHNLLHLVELQPQLADRARRNLYLNDLRGIVTEYDIAGGQLPSYLHNSFDVVHVNPPFYLENEGRKAPRSPERRLAQMESSATFSNFLTAAREACDSSNPDAFIAVIHDIRERERIDAAINENGLMVSSCREMRHNETEAATRIVMELQAVGEDKELKELSSKETTGNPKPLILFPGRAGQGRQVQYGDEIEDFFESLPTPSLRIGHLRNA